MSLPRYPRYKDSGVEWLGEVPEHWTIAPIKALATLRSGGTPDKNNAAYWDGDVPWASAKDLKQDVLTDTQDHITSEAVAVGAAALVPAGCILVVVRGMILAHTFPVVRTAAPMAINQDLKAVIPRAPMTASFLTWLLRGSSDETLRRLDEAGHGTKALRMEAWTSMPLPVPSAAEQKAIASFLERESVAIDQLTAEQERLIELLAEKREAAISHAVTKGLNPDTPMKPSRVESFGDIPAHWSIRTIKTFATLQRGYDLTDAERRDGPYPVVTSGGIAGVHDEFKARGPGVVTGRYGSTGRLFYVEEDFWPHNTALYVSDFHENVPRFAWYSLRTIDFAAHSAKAAVPGIDRNDIHVLPVAVPPADEQHAIAEHLDRQTLMFDVLIAEAERAIALLQERRTALISAAVTGKIDVRGLTDAAA